MTPELQQAVTGAQQQGTPSSPLGSFPELAKMYQSSFQLPQSNAAIQGTANVNAVKLANQKRAAEDATNNYRQINKPDGGYAFVDGSGKEISAWDYARATGNRPDKILEQSQNPIDIGFVQDYRNLQDFMNALVNNDKEKIKTFTDTQPDLSKYKKNIPGLIQAFQQHYPTVFGGTGSGNQPTTSTYVPNAKTASNNALYSPSGIGG